MNNSSNGSERRDFLKTAGGVLAAGFPAIISAQSVTNAIKVGLVGCGGRGSGAAAQALAADDATELTAVADIDQSQIDKCLQSLKKISKSAPRVKVEPNAQYLGLDAFQKVIDAKVDVVLLATPPGFRPLHLASCIAAGKHVFCEKPISTDAPGVRSVMQTSDLAKQKNLSLVAGFCWRYNNMIQDTFQQIESGAIGKLVAYYATYYTNPVKPMPAESTRPAGMSDVEWQIRNWYNFVWLCGDSLVEQAIHSADKIAWAMHDEPPVSCVGVGGRNIPNETGNIYDHFEVNYIYPNGVRAFLANRQIVGCHNENADYMLGSEGTCTIGKGPQPRIAGKVNWTFSGQQY
ncbi:MAG: Gfo/Idh/MocA family oxidoreductase, partial [Candidatus Solibacter sp.]